MMAILKGRSCLLGDNIGAVWLLGAVSEAGDSKSREPSDTSRGDILPGKKTAISIAPNDIIVAGANLGSCHGRDAQAIISRAVDALLRFGVLCITAVSFDRLFFRLAVNSGLWPIQSPDAHKMVVPGEIVEVNLQTNELICGAGKAKICPLPEIVLKILEAGGLVPYARRQLARF